MSENQGEGAGDHTYGDHYSSGDTSSGSGFAFTNESLGGGVDSTAAGSVPGQTGASTPAVTEKEALHAGESAGVYGAVTSGDLAAPGEKTDVVGSVITVLRTILAALGFATGPIGALGASIGVASMYRAGDYGRINFGSAPSSVGPSVGEGDGRGGGGSPVLGFGGVIANGYGVPTPSAPQAITLPSISAFSGPSSSRSGMVLPPAPQSSVVTPGTAVLLIAGLALATGAI